MSRGRLILVGVLCAALSLIGVAGMVTVRGTTVDLGKKMAACVPPEKRDVTITPSSAQDACLEDVIRTAVSEDRVEEILPELDRLNAVGIQLCHGPAHRAVSSLWPADGNWRALIDRVNVVNCNSGLLHGLFDAAGKQPWSVAEWEPMARWCANVPRVEATPDCGDAVGHAAWDRFKDRATAAEVCKLIGFHFWVVECADGMVMQEFDPASRNDRQAVDFTDIRPICAHAPSDDTTGVREGCLRGIGYLLSEYFQMPQPTAGQSQQDAITAAVNDRLRVCEQFGTEAEPCIDRFFSLLPYHFSGATFDAAELFCTAAGKWEAVCRKNFTLANQRR